MNLFLAIETLLSFLKNCMEGEDNETNDDRYKGRSIETLW